MAQPKIDDREVKKINAAISRDGQAKAAARFDENSPEFRKAQHDRAARRAVGAKQRALHETNATDQEGRNMSQPSKPTPAQERAAKQGRAAAQERVAAMKRQQAQQNARIKEQSSSQSQGLGM